MKICKYVNSPNSVSSQKIASGVLGTMPHTPALNFLGVLPPGCCGYRPDLNYQLCTGKLKNTMYWSEKGSIGVYDAFLQRRKRLSMLYNSCKNMIFFNLRKHPFLLPLCRVPSGGCFRRLDIFHSTRLYENRGVTTLCRVT